MKYTDIRKYVLFIGLLLVISNPLNGQDSIVNNKIPVISVFYHFDRAIVGSFTYHYGLNYVIAGIGTYGIVTSGLDWKWYNLSNNHKWISNAGFVSVGAGGLVPILVPLGVYLFGRSENDRDLQVTALALGQSAILAGLIASGIKVFTGRVPPDFPENKTDYSSYFRFGFLRGGAYEGWPSTHTAIAFAMSTTLMELYPENTAIKIGSLTYASLIGIGVSTNIHWLSDAFAGMFIGYAIGKTVGKNFKNLMDSHPQNNAWNFSITPSEVKMQYNF